LALLLLCFDILSIIAGVNLPALYNFLVLIISDSVLRLFLEPFTYFFGTPRFVLETFLNFLAIIFSFFY
tara:strand:+ start:4359 stop:4565 length:207 start_codon:yes stop_codon:yes gene_type:complete